MIFDGQTTKNRSVSAFLDRPLFNFGIVHFCGPFNLHVFLTVQFDRLLFSSLGHQNPLSLKIYNDQFYFESTISIMISFWVDCFGTRLVHLKGFWFFLEIVILEMLTPLFNTNYTGRLMGVATLFWHVQFAKMHLTQSKNPIFEYFAPEVKCRTKIWKYFVY